MGDAFRNWLRFRRPYLLRKEEEVMLEAYREALLWVQRESKRCDDEIDILMLSIQEELGQE